MADQSLGAPPDYFNREGHGWDLVPMDPVQLAAHDYRPLQLGIRANLRHAAGLRVDHALGLLRLFQYPRNGTTRDGAYVAQPTRALLDLVLLEAARADAFAVLEEFGTPPADGLGELTDADVLRLDVATNPEFRRARARSLLMLSSHDQATAVGLWSGSDARDLAARGLSAPHWERAGRRSWRRLAGVAHDAGVEEAVVAITGVLAASEATLVALSIEDLIGSAQRVNLPGYCLPAFPSFARATPRLPDAFDIGLTDRLVAVLNRRASAPRIMEDM